MLKIAIYHAETEVVHIKAEKTLKASRTSLKLVWSLIC